MPDEAMELIENMAASDIAILRDQTHTPTKKSLLELTSQDALLTQNKLLRKISSWMKPCIASLIIPLAVLVGHIIDHF